MTTTGKRPPQNDAELARDLDSRLASLEHPSATRVGKWVLTTGDSDDLVASYVGGGSVVLSAPPKVGDSPDATEQVKAKPSLSLVRSTRQDIPRNAVVGIQWDSIEQSRGEWGLGNTPPDTVELPESGLYSILLTVDWADRQAYPTQGTLKIDADDAVTHQPDPYDTTKQAYTLPALRWLDEGTVIGGWVYSTNDNNALSVQTRLDIACLVREEGLRSGD